MFAVGQAEQLEYLVLVMREDKLKFSFLHIPLSDKKV